MTPLDRLGFQSERGGMIYYAVACIALVLIATLLELGASRSQRGLLDDAKNVASRSLLDLES